MYKYYVFKCMCIHTPLFLYIHMCMYIYTYARMICLSMYSETILGHRIIYTFVRTELVLCASARFARASTVPTTVYTPVVKYPI